MAFLATVRLPAQALTPSADDERLIIFARISSATDRFVDYVKLTTNKAAWRNGGKARLHADVAAVYGDIDVHTGVVRPDRCYVLYDLGEKRLGLDASLMDRTGISDKLESLKRTNRKPFETGCNQPASTSSWTVLTSSGRDISGSGTVKKEALDEGGPYSYVDLLAGLAQSYEGNIGNPADSVAISCSPSGPVWHLSSMSRGRYRLKSNASNHFFDLKPPKEKTSQSDGVNVPVDMQAELGKQVQAAVQSACNSSSWAPEPGLIDIWTRYFIDDYRKKLKTCDKDKNPRGVTPDDVCFKYRGKKSSGGKR